MKVLSKGAVFVIAIALTLTMIPMQAFAEVNEKLNDPIASVSEENQDGASADIEVGMADGKDLELAEPDKPELTESNVAEAQPNQQGEAQDLNTELYTESVSIFSGNPNGLKAEVSQDESTVTITAAGEPYVNATSVRFPTWSDEGGQNDIVWYQARKQSDGSWKCVVPISAHKSTGRYQVHAYATLGGRERLVKGTTFSVTRPTCSVSIVTTDSATGSFKVTASSIVSSSPVTRVEIPVWSESGSQDDLVWYPATRNADGTYSVTSSVARHKYAPGNYTAHVYITCANGTRTCARGTTSQVQLPALFMTATPDVTESNYTVTASGGLFGIATSVRFPTWSDEGGQNDIVWYQARKQSDGSWKCVVPISAHKSTGRYQVHAYATLGGRERLVKGTTFSVTRPKASMRFEDVDNSAGTFKIVIGDINSPSGVNDIQIAVWSSDLGQDDLVWYNATRQTDGTYSVNINARNHNSGQSYYAHAYLTTPTGIRVIAVGKENEKVLSLSNYVSISGKEGSGSRTVWIMNPTNASSVRVPTWSNTGGQDDLVWYNATHVGGGLWKATINTRNLRHAGTCTYHIYVNDDCITGGSYNVAQNEVWSISGDVTLDNYLRQIISQRGTDLYTLYRYVASFPYYRGSEDPGSGWTIPMAKEMCQRGGGNCYRYAALFGWLARAAGYNASICSGGVKLRSGGYDSHAWVEIHTNSGTVICDPEEQHAYPQYNWYWQTYSSTHFTYKIYFKE